MADCEPPIMCEDLRRWFGGADADCLEARIKRGVLADVEIHPIGPADLLGHR